MEFAIKYVVSSPDAKAILAEPGTHTFALHAKNTQPAFGRFFEYNNTWTVTVQQQARFSKSASFLPRAAGLREFAFGLIAKYSDQRR